MPTPSAIMDGAAALMNDTSQVVYTDAVQLPYLNIALNVLQEEFELANVPVTNDVSAVLALTAGDTVVSFTSSPALPSNLIEIQRLWERTSGVIPWVPMTRKEFLPRSREDQNLTQFLIWSWIDQEIRLIESTADIDLKIDYIKSIFGTPIAIGNIAVDLPIINSLSYLEFKTAALCSMFIGENETRAASLEAKATDALDRALGIPTKGRQSITTRRLPFMGSYRRRGYV